MYMNSPARHSTASTRASSRLSHAGIFASLILLAACQGPNGEYDEDEQVSLQEQPLVGGTDTNLRPEIGMMSASNSAQAWTCTATLIAPSYVLTAGHCVDFSNNLNNAKVKLPNASVPYTVSAVHTFGAYQPAAFALQDFAGSVDDVALLRLASPVPSSVATPAEIALTPPSTSPGPYDTQTIFGYGCKSRSSGTGSGVKQYATFTFGNQTQLLCSGDSGGPVVSGSPSAGGAIWGVNSNYGTQTGIDSFGSAAFYKEEILGVMRKWEGSPVEFGIGRNGLTYSTTTLPTSSDCMVACQADAKCRGYTFRATGTKCELKSALGEWYVSADATSYAGVNLSQQVFQTRTGNTYRSVTATTPEVCVHLCAVDANCKAYAVSAATGTCDLKNTLGTTVVDYVSISGIKRTMETSTDRPGVDYSHVTAPSAAECQRTCSVDQRCRTFSWIASTKVCYLHANQTKPVARTGATSGIKRGLEMNTDRIGADLRNYDINFRNTPQVCQADCANDAACQSFTFAPAGRNGEKAHCWLKSGIPTPSAAEGLVSGVRGLDFF